MNNLDRGENEQLATYLIKIIRQTLYLYTFTFYGKELRPGGLRD